MAGLLALMGMGIGSFVGVCASSAISALSEQVASVPSLCTRVAVSTAVAGAGVLMINYPVSSDDRSAGSAHPRFVLGCTLLAFGLGSVWSIATLALYNRLFPLTAAVVYPRGPILGFLQQAATYTTISMSSFYGVGGFIINMLFG